ncbi:MAG: fasciclin domain-containing protein, partial [Prevotella sp.]|nr:fasciclin domain-containing protein [Prevotella sp.]
MKRKNRYIMVMGLAIAALTFAACSDTWDDHNNRAAEGVEEGSLWQAIQQNPELSNFSSVVEACGYDKSLASAQAFTVFAPTNSCFSKEEADRLIAAYHAEKGKVDDKDNSTIKEFLQNHIALYNYSVSQASNDTIMMMNGKNILLTSSKIGNSPLTSSNKLYSNGVLFTVSSLVDYFPNVFEYMRRDAELDSLYSFFYNERFYRKEFQASKSVEGGIVDGRTIYLDSVFRQQNDLFDYDFLNARLNNEDSTYWVLMPTNEAWRKLVDEYQNYFNYDNTVDKRDSVFYTNTRMAIMKGTAFSRTTNTDAIL